ncbi:MAG: toll/interleukin-1 receptor domain-containing protein [Parabacteroides sp.]|nr:toll/interleukin-1 receptor domain-containing protein [Parabacteroides sp.]
MRPRIGISYCHSARGVAEKICDRLEKNGFKVLIDFKDLKYGHDMNYFMEELITETGTLIILIDNEYAQKADERKGGVGTETFLISSEMYSQARPDRFIPCALEKDGKGGFILPKYLKSRMCADFTSEEQIEKNWASILTHLTSEERHEKSDDDNFVKSIDVGRDYIAQLNSSFSIRVAQEFLEHSFQYVDSLRVRREVKIDSREFYEECIALYQKLIPVRNQCIELIYIMEKAPSDQMVNIVTEMLEMLLTLKEPPLDKSTINTINEYRHASHRVFAYDIFLHSIATLMRLLKFSEIHEILTPGFTPTEYDRTMGYRQPNTYHDFFITKDDVFKRQPEYEKFISPGLQLVKENATRGDISFDPHLIEADVLIYLHSLVYSFYWLPMTICYCESTDMPRAFFMKCSGKRFFKYLAQATGISSGNDMRSSFLENGGDERIKAISSLFFAPKVSKLVNLDELDTRG